MPVARIVTSRRRLDLLNADGESLAEVAADDISAQTLGESTTLSRWREVEVELTGGDQRLLRAASERLRRGGLHPAGRSAKVERALGLSPAGEKLARLDGSSTAGDVVLTYLRIHVEAVKSADPRVRRGEPDSVHQMRVAIRRVRSTLRVFRTVLRRQETAHLAAELRWLGGQLGGARDNEVLAAHLEYSLRGTPAEQVIGPVSARCQAHFARARSDARAVVLDALRSPRYFSLLDRLDTLLAEPPITPEAALPARDVLVADVRRAYRRTAHRMRRALRMPAGAARDTALHGARKAAKRCRYAAETAAPAIGKPARRFATRMKKTQSVLGVYQDTVIARPLERQLGMSAHLAAENAFTYGLLYERDTHRAEHLRAHAAHKWTRASRHGARRWFS